MHVQYLCREGGVIHSERVYKLTEPAESLEAAKRSELAAAEEAKRNAQGKGSLHA